MNPSTQESRVAALLLEDARRLSERAQQRGVTAYLEQPERRQRPNARFLRNTMANVAHSNRRVEEEEMWVAWQAQQGRHNDPREDAARSPSRSPHAERSAEAGAQRPSSDGDASPQGGAGGGGGLRDSDGEVERVFVGKARRGRGGTGSRMDITGPFMDAAQGGGQLVNEHIEVRRLKGPSKPAAWVAGGSSGLSLDGGRSTSSEGSRARKERRRRKSRRREKEERKGKHKSEDKAKRARKKMKKKKRKREEA